MRGILGFLCLIAVCVASAGCAETVRCPEGEIFDEDGACIPIPDAGPDASRADGG